MGFKLAAAYGLALATLIESWHYTVEFLLLFCKGDVYTLGNFGQVWADWHSVGCAFVGLVNLAVARDERRESFRAGGRRSIGLCTAFIYGVWGVQNTYYCLYRTDIFTPLMWMNAIACLAVGFLSARGAAAEKISTNDGKRR